MYCYQALLMRAMSGIDATSIVPTVTAVAYAILAIGFLVSLYRAAMRGGDLQSALSSALTYVIVALIIVNWGNAFRGLNSAFDQVAQAIGNSSGAGDMFMTWLKDLQRQSQTNPFPDFMNAITGGISALITVGFVVIAYVVYVVAIIAFCFFYALCGVVLYVLGPLVLAFLPITGANQIAKSYTVNLVIWNAWGVLYAIFGALITAIHTNQVNEVLGSGFFGFLDGVSSSTLLGLVSVFYALAIIAIPFIANKVLSGDVGSATFSAVRIASGLVKQAINFGAGLAAGFASGGSGGGGGGGAGGGGGGGGGGSGPRGHGGANSGSGGGSGAGSATASSSPPPTPPPIPTVAQMIRNGIANAVQGTIGSSGSGAAGGAGAGSAPKGRNP